MGKSTVANARLLRQRQTPAERRLWAVLRDARLDGWTFRRQHPAGRFVLDFYCPAASLQSSSSTAPSTPTKPTTTTPAPTDLESCGARLLRIPNDDILTNLIRTSLYSSRRAPLGRLPARAA